MRPFTSFHRWQADNVQEEDEESCEKWLLHQSPEMTTVREAEEYRPGRVRYRYITRKVPTEVQGEKVCVLVFLCITVVQVWYFACNTVWMHAHTWSSGLLVLLQSIE